MVKLPQAPGRSRLRGFLQQFAGFRQFAGWAGAHPLLCAAVFFVFAFALRLLCGALSAPMAATVYPSEIRYLHLARSLAQGGPLLIQGFPTQFQKILYPLLVSPAFLLARDPLAQVKLVGVINCLAMASMVFPVALLVKKLSPKPAVLLLTLAFTAALPDFMYTATFLSEPLYWPLCLWVFYFFHSAMTENRPRRRLPLFALFGFFTYLSYLTKEVSAAFLIAGAAMLVVEGVRGKKFVRNGLALGVSIAAFFVPFLIVKRALFPGAGNSYAGSLTGYDQIGLSALGEPGVFGYMVYSAAATFAAAILSFYVLPVLLPLFDLRRLDGKQRRLYLFVLLSLAVTAGAVAYTVSIREDLGDRVPRLHLRMLAPMAVPLVALCFDGLLSKDGKKRTTSGHQPVPILTAALCVLTVILLPVLPPADNWFDHASLAVTVPVGTLALFGMDTANGFWLACLLGMLALTAAGARCFLHKKKQAVLAMLLCAMLAVGAADNFISYRNLGLAKEPVDIQTVLGAGRKTVDYLRALSGVYFSGAAKGDPTALARAAVSAGEYLRQIDNGIPDDAIVVCTDTANAPTALCFFTYAPQQLRAFPLGLEVCLDSLQPGSRELLIDDLSETKGMRVRYIVAIQGCNPFTNAEVVFEQSPYFVLRNLDPAKLVF